MNDWAFKFFSGIWICYTILIMSIAVLFLIWSLKNKQYNDQKRAAQLPLEIDDKSKDKDEEDEHV